MTSLVQDSPFTQFSPVVIPDLPSLSLTEAEQQLVVSLQMRAFRDRGYMLTRNAYYEGTQAVDSLGIAIPPQLQDLRQVVAWPKFAVDPYADRLSVEGFHGLNSTELDMDLWALWLGNYMPAEQTLAFVDALVMGRSFFTVGSPETPGDMPVMCAESPLNIAVRWDPRTRKPSAALQTYWMQDTRAAAILLPEQTIHLAEDVNGKWKVEDRDPHNFGSVPLVMMPNKARTNRRDGMSEITLPLMSLTDAGCRTMVNLAVSGELYAVPGKYILGATEADFQEPDGTPKTAFQTYINLIQGFERDEEGELPQVGQWKPYDPSVYTRVIDLYAAHVASETAATPQELGLYTQGNPPSADAVNFSSETRNLRIRNKKNLFGQALVELIQMAVRFQTNGTLPTEYQHLEVDWADSGTETPTATADALSKYTQGDNPIVPPTSDVLLKRAGFSGLERARIAQERTAFKAKTSLEKIADGLTGGGSGNGSGQ